MTYQRDPHGREAQHLHKFVDVCDTHILEIGCGNGALTWGYGAQAKEVVGLDLDIESLQAAIATCPTNLEHRVCFLSATADRLPFASERFDVVLFSSSL